VLIIEGQVVVNPNLPFKSLIRTATIADIAGEVERKPEIWGVSPGLSCWRRSRVPGPVVRRRHKP
jgi:hypothetical protein